MYYNLNFNLLRFQNQYFKIIILMMTRNACRNIGVRKLQEGRIQKRALLVGKFLAIYFHGTYWL